MTGFITWFVVCMVLYVASAIFAEKLVPEHLFFAGSTYGIIQMCLYNLLVLHK